MSIINKIELIKDMLQKTVDQGTKTVEEVHLAIGDIAFDILEKQGKFDEEAKSLRKQHNDIVTTVYAKIREVNESIGGFASDIFESLEDGEIILKNMDDTADESKKKATEES